MKRTITRTALLAGSCLGVMGAMATANALTFTFDSLTGAALSFGGAHNFTFTPVGSLSPVVNQFQIKSSDGTGAAINLDGFMTGSWKIGAVTPGSLQTAPVTGSGQVTINDGLGHALTATLSFSEIEVLTTSVGGNGAILGNLNLTGINYTGHNSDLLALKADKIASETISWTYTAANQKTLSQLASSPNQILSYSGEISANRVVADGGLTLVLLGVGLAGVEGLRRRSVK